MRQIRLVPAKHEAPFCEAYDSEQEVRRFERAVREHRAYSDAQLVAAIFSKLLPGGCLPSGAHGSLAKLHDLSLLEAHGVVIDAASARAAFVEASEWVDRIGASLSSGSAAAPKV